MFKLCTNIAASTRYSTTDTEVIVLFFAEVPGAFFSSFLMLSCAFVTFAYRVETLASGLRDLGKTVDCKADAVAMERVLQGKVDKVNADGFMTADILAVRGMYREQRGREEWQRRH